MNRVFLGILSVSVLLGACASNPPTSKAVVINQPPPPPVAPPPPPSPPKPPTKSANSVTEYDKPKACVPGQKYVINGRTATCQSSAPHEPSGS